MVAECVLDTGFLIPVSKTLSLNIDRSFQSQGGSFVDLHVNDTEASPAMSWWRPMSCSTSFLKAAGTEAMGGWMMDACISVASAINHLETSPV